MKNRADTTAEEEVMDQCHLCGNDLFSEPIFRLTGMPKAAQYYPENHEFAEDKGITLTIWQCSGCGLVQHIMKPVEYFREVITAATLSPKSRLSRLNQMKEFTERFKLFGKNVLDIGTGKGEMLDVLEEVGCRATGLEASLESVNFGKASARNMICGYIGDEGKIAGAPYDAFIFLNYFEHLPKPGAIIRNIYRNTTVEAVGLVVVPNLDYLLNTRALYEFVADHISYFTKSTLTYAFEANGFEVLDCRTINEDNDIAVTVRKKKLLDLTRARESVDILIDELQRIIAYCRSRNMRVAVWGAGHRTLALLALSKAFDIAYIVDSARFKQGKLAPVLHTSIVSPDRLKEDAVDLLIIMVPGLYPDEVLKTVKEMNIGSKIAMLRGNTIEFVK